MYHMWYDEATVSDNKKKEYGFLLEHEHTDEKDEDDPIPKTFFKPTIQDGNPPISIPREENLTDVTLGKLPPPATVVT